MLIICSVLLVISNCVAICCCCYYRRQYQNLRNGEGNDDPRLGLVDDHEVLEEEEESPDEDEEDQDIPIEPLEPPAPVPNPQADPPAAEVAEPPQGEIGH